MKNKIYVKNGETFVNINGTEETHENFLKRTKSKNEVIQYIENMNIPLRFIGEAKLEIIELIKLIDNVSDNKKPRVPKVALEYYDKYKDKFKEYDDWFRFWYSPLKDDFPNVSELSDWLYDNSDENIIKQRELALATLISNGPTSVIIEEDKKEQKTELNKSLNQVTEIVKHLKDLGVQPYYITENYLIDFVDNEQITEEQLEILENEINLKSKVDEVFLSNEIVKLPNRIIKAIKQGLESNYSIDALCIDWELNTTDFEFDRVINDWLAEDNFSERYSKLFNIYCYATKNLTSNKEL